jgi:hypothetical protein
VAADRAEGAEPLEEGAERRRRHARIEEGGSGAALVVAGDAGSEQLAAGGEAGGLGRLPRRLDGIGGRDDRSGHGLPRHGAAEAASLRSLAAARPRRSSPRPAARRRRSSLTDARPGRTRHRRGRSPACASTSRFGRAAARSTEAIAAGEGEGQCEQSSGWGSRRYRNAHGSLPKNRMGGLHWYV